MAFILVVNRWKSKLCLGNLSVVKIYIIRPKPGPVAKKCNSKAFRLGIEPASSESQYHLSQSSLVHLIVIWVIVAQWLVHIIVIWVIIAQRLVHLTVVHLKDLISIWDSDIFWVWIKLSRKPKPNPLFTDEREPHLLIIILLLLIIIIKESILLYHHPITVKLNVVLHVTWAATRVSCLTVLV